MAARAIALAEKECLTRGRVALRLRFECRKVHRVHMSCELVDEVVGEGHCRHATRGAVANGARDLRVGPTAQPASFKQARAAIRAAAISAVANAAVLGE